MATTPRIRAVGGAVGIALLAAACGSSGDDLRTEAGQDPVATTSVTDGSLPTTPPAPAEPGAIEDVPSALANMFDAAFPAPLIPVGEIISGGPPPDGIPPLDEPNFSAVDEVDFLAADEPVVALEVNGDARAFPLQIMTWHELVNTEVGGEPVTISYCPLCNSAVAYDRRVGDRLLDFGTSGRLFNSSLVMYDRQTESLWTHFNGRAVVGALTGLELETLPISIVGWSEWAAAHPEGIVLNTDTGYSRDYGRNPYEGYDDPSTRPFLFRGEVPDDFTPKTRVIGLSDGDTSVVVPRSLVEADGVFDVSVGESPVTIWWRAGAQSALDTDAIDEAFDVGAVATFDPTVEGDVLTFSASTDGFVDAETGSTWTIFGEAVSGPLAGQQLDAVTHHDTFWFAWISFNPDAVVVGT